MRTAQSLLALQSKANEDGTFSSNFSYVFETALFFPFLAQCVFYLCRLWNEKRTKDLFIKALQIDFVDLRPCLFYSVFCAAGPIFEIQAQGYLPGSTVIIIKQLSILMAACFEALLLKSYPTIPLVAVMAAQCGMVIAFNTAGEIPSILAPGPPAPLRPDQSLDVSDGNLAAGGEAFGMAMCLLSVVLSAFAGILQQKYLQMQAMEVSINTKLFYQHIIGFGIVLLKLALNKDAVGKVMENGFFDGWTVWVAAFSVSTWFCYFLSTCVTAYVSSMAAAMAQAVTIVTVGIGEHLLFGKEFSNMQWGLMLGICINAMLFMHFKAEKAKKAQAAEEAKKRQ